MKKAGHTVYKNMKNTSKKTVVLLFGAFAYNFIVYLGGRSISRNLYHYNLTSYIDDIIPLQSWMVIIYLGAYLFWAVNYYLSVKYDTSTNERFIISHMIGETVCLAAFILLPTTMNRPLITGTSVFDQLLKLVYAVDKPDNLMPSIHCYLSWLCWIGVRNNAHVSKGYQHFSLIMAIAVCLSTLMVKQHVLIDALTGVLLAEVSYFAAGYVQTKVYIPYLHIWPEERIRH